MKNYQNPDSLKKHAIELVELYRPMVKDNENGGYYCAYLDNGEVYDREIKDPVSITRFILDFCFGIFLGGPKEYKDYIRHGLEFLEIIHRDHVNGGFHQQVWKNRPVIGKKVTYGQAFCLCAVSNSYKAGIKEAYPLIGDIFDVMEENLYEKQHSLYVDECSNDFTQISSYRGQNCNMHMTEAMLAAYEATRENKYLDRAYDMAHKRTVELSSKSNGMIWEHYNQRWEIDWEYNKDDPKNLYKPYGFLPGHFAEWSKLLLILERYRPEKWQLETAERLFQKAVKVGWDRQNGGCNYTFDSREKILDTDRYYWTHAEIFAAAALLALRTGNQDYWTIYDDCWDYCDKHFLDSRYGGWYRVLSRDGKPLSDRKSPPGKSDYHVIGACYEIVRSMDKHAPHA